MPDDFSLGDAAKNFAQSGLSYEGGADMSGYMQPGKPPPMPEGLLNPERNAGGPRNLEPVGFGSDPRLRGLLEQAGLM